MLHRFLSELGFRLRALFRRSRMERELDDELRFHLEREAEKHVQAGISRAEAERLASASFGGFSRIKDDARDERGIAFWDTTMQDLRYAVRSLRGRKPFTTGVVLTLALGIGANATMFGIVDRVLFRPPPALRQPDQVHRFYRHSTENGAPRLDRNFSFALYLDLVHDLKSFTRLAAFQTRRQPLGDGENVRELPVTVVSAGFFDFFDARPARGRFFTPAEDSVPDGAPVSVLGYQYWQIQYGGRDVIGQPLRVGRTLTTIIGVAPEHFVGMSDQGVPAVYLPITTYAFAMRGARYPQNHGWSWLELIARRAPGVRPEAAEAELTAAFHQSWRNAAAIDPGWGSPEDAGVRAELGPVQLERGPQAGRESRVAVWVSGVALVVLLIACANVANLLLSRSVSRRREIALRLALGVSRLRLLRQLLTESLVLASLGGIAGLLLAHWGMAALRTWFLPPDLQTTVFTDARTLRFAAGVTLVAALLTGLVPAWSALRGDVAEALKAGAREGGRQRARARTALLVLQCGLSVVLLVGAGLFVRSLQNVRSYRLGYDPEVILFAQANSRGVTLDKAALAALNQRMLEAAREIPGVTRVTPAASIPFWSNEGRGLYVPGVDSVNTLGRFLLQAGNAEYFATMGTRIIRGRAFDETDGETSSPVVVVSQGMARALWPGQDAIGKCFRIGSRTAPCTTVIGVAEEIRLRTLLNPREYGYYIPASQYQDRLDPQLLVRVQGRAADQVEPLRRRLQTEMPGAAYVNVMPLSDLVDPNLRSWEFGANLFVAFGGLALALAAIGLYSLLAYDVAQGTRDMSVRIALGASASRVVRLVVARGLRLVAAGLVLGAVVALWAAPLLKELMFSQSPRDPAVFGAVAGVLLVVGLGATLIPARRAARVDPVVALREE